MASRPELRALIALAALSSSACQDQLSFTERTDYDEWQQAPTDQVDILWVVDNSSSMAQEQALLVAGFSSFAAALDASGTDFQLAVISTDLDYANPERGRFTGDPGVITPDVENYIDVFGTSATVGLQGSGKEKGLEAAWYALSPALTSPGAPNAGFLRSEANLLLVFVSDEDDCSDEGALEGEPNTACYAQYDRLVPVPTYISRFESLKQTKSQVQLGAIVGPDAATALCDENTIPGSRYAEAARLSGGLSNSICETDWSSFLGDLGLNAVGIFTTFELGNRPRPETLVVTVDGEEVPVDPIDGYTYDDVAIAITFHGASIPPRGAIIGASYTIAAGG